LEAGMEVVQALASLEVEMKDVVLPTERIARLAVSAAGAVALALGLCHM